MITDNIYTCDACLYTFRSDHKPPACPDCGKHEVRAATENEKAQFLKIQQALAVDESLVWGDADFSTAGNF